MADSPHPKRTVSGGRLAMLAFAALFVLVLCIAALQETDDIWIIVLTVPAIILIAAVVIIDVVRVIDRDQDDDG